MAARIPFDDRVNGQAKLNDFDLGLIQAFLQEIKSDLFEESKHISMPDLSRNMLIAKGPDEDLRPANVGILFFCREPERFFSRCWIELVWHKDNSGRNFTEKYFKGPLHVQLRSVLDFIQNNIIEEKVVKVQGRAEAERFWNYPYAAVEESVSNAVYHKSYEIGSPIEIQIWPDKIEILSYPGPVPPVDAQILRHEERIVAREYRNRRIGDFLKELHLTEGRGTGFPTIYREMRKNGSPDPVFKTDEHCTYFLTTLHAVVSDHASDQAISLNFNILNDLLFYCNQVSNQVSDQVSDQVNAIINVHFGVLARDILRSIGHGPKSKRSILNEVGLSNQTKNSQRYIDPLREIGWIEYTIPENLKDRNQKYRLTPAGLKLINLIKG